MTIPVIKPGLEAIAHQTDREFFEFLVGQFALMKAPLSEGQTSKVKRDNLIIADIQKGVYDRTGLNIELNIVGDSSINAWVSTPDIKENHVLAIGAYKWGANPEKVEQLFSKDASAIMQGTIDLKKGVVSGFFSKILNEICITSTALNKLAADEVAAIFSHELGHLMSYFEYFKASTLFDINLIGAIQEFTAAEYPTHRVQITNDFKKSTDLNLPNLDVISQKGDVSEFVAVVLSEASANPRAALNANVYDETSWEAASDQFVSRIGGGRALATALHKLFKTSGHMSYQNLFIFGLSQVFGLATFAYISTVTFGVGAVLYLWLVGNPYRDVYDAPVARIQRIRNDVMSALKDPKVPKKRIQQILDDLTAIDKTLEEGKDKDSIHRYFAALVSSNVREQRKLMLEQKQLEYLANNDLYRHGAKFKLLS